MKKITAVILSILMIAAGTAISAEETDIENTAELMAVNEDYALSNTGFTYSMDYFTNDEMYNISVKAANNTSVNTRCDMFAAVYNEDGILKVVGKQTQMLYHDSINNIVFNLDTNADNGGQGSTVKVFLWEHNTMRPLSDAVVFDTNLVR